MGGNIAGYSEKRHLIEKSELWPFLQSELGEMFVCVCLYQCVFVCVCVIHILCHASFLIRIILGHVGGKVTSNSFRIYTISPRLRGNPAWFGVWPLTRGIRFGFARGILSPW